MPLRALGSGGTDEWHAAAAGATQVATEAAMPQEAVSTATEQAETTVRPALAVGLEPTWPTSVCTAEAV